jgi:methionyl-tRNA synthetase
VARNNGELVNNIGNYCHRVLDFVSSKCGGVVPEVSSSGAGLEECIQLGAELQAAVHSYIDNLEKARLREGLKAVLAVSSIGNAFLNRCEPWKRLKVDPASAHTHLAASVGVVRLLAALLSPFTPSVAGLYLHYLGLDAQSGCLTDELLAAVDSPQSLLPARHVLGPKPCTVFSKIDTDLVDAFRSRFAGKQNGKETVLASKTSRRKHQREKHQTVGDGFQAASLAA